MFRRREVDTGVEMPLNFLRKFYALDWKKLAKRNPRGTKRLVFKSFSFWGLFTLAYASLLEVERSPRAALRARFASLTCSARNRTRSVFRPPLPMMHRWGPRNEKHRPLARFSHARLSPCSPPIKKARKTGPCFYLEVERIELSSLANTTEMTTCLEP
jgi:hypothetical protein